MIGAIAGLATSVGSSIYGGIKSHKAAKEYKAQLKDLEKKQNDWYTSRYNSDYTQRADVQSLLNRASEEARKQINSARGVQAVMGGSNESVELARQAANEGLANTATNIAAQASAYKDSVDLQNQQNIASRSQQYMNLYSQSAANASKAASAGMQAGMSLVAADAQSYLDSGKGIFSNLFKKK